MCRVRAGRIKNRSNKCRDVFEKLLSSTSKLPFITCRLQPNLHPLQHMRGQRDKWRFRKIPQIKVEIQPKWDFILQVRCPSLLTDLR
jgi:hypothetical protein